MLQVFPNSFSPSFIGLPLLLKVSIPYKLSIFLIVASVCLICARPNHLRRISLSLSSIGATSNLTRESIFFFNHKSILSLINLGNLILECSIFLCFLTVQLRPIEHVRSYNRPKNFLFRLVGICLSHVSAEAFNHYNQPVLILCDMPSSINLNCS